MTELLEESGSKTRSRKRRWVLENRLLRRYLPLVQEDLTQIYFRDLQKWLIVAPLIGLITGLLITGLVVVLLGKLWPAVLAYYVGHHWAIVPGLLLAFIVTGLIMQYATPNPDEHSTEEVIKSYHEHGGDIDMRPFFPKLLAAITTVGFGGSAALEGPSIYGGGALGSWLWRHTRRLGLTRRDRRIMLICGAAAGMSAVFRAPLTGIVFSLEMPYRDDLAHEALLPSLIASVVSYITMGSFLGTTPLFNFAAGASYARHDLYWSAALGLIVGLVAMVFVVTFRRVRRFVVALRVPHWIKMAAGGLGTGLCALLFLHLYPGNLMPIGPNYEAVGYILGRHYDSPQLLTFSVLKLAATIFTLGVGGVSAMFVPLFLTGGAIGTAFAQSIVHTPELGLYAAVGMASFISAGYKTPLAAVVFVAEATGGHAFLIPALIGAAVAYAVSGDASASGDQRLHEGVKLEELRHVTVSQVMQPRTAFAQADSTVEQAIGAGLLDAGEEILVVVEGGRAVGAVSSARLLHVPPAEWTSTRLGEIVDGRALAVTSDTDLTEAVRLLLESHGPAVLVVHAEDAAQGVVTRADVLRAVDPRRWADEQERER